MIAVKGTWYCPEIAWGQSTEVYHRHLPQDPFCFMHLPDLQIASPSND